MKAKRSEDRLSQMDTRSKIGIVKNRKLERTVNDYRNRTTDHCVSWVRQAVRYLPT